MLYNQPKYYKLHTVQPLFLLLYSEISTLGACSTSAIYHKPCSRLSIFRNGILYVLIILKPSYRHPEWKIRNFPIGFTVQHSGVQWEQFTRNLNGSKLWQTFFDSYQIYNIINPLYCHLFSLTTILNLSYTCTAIFSIL